jgi:hypothetical protein
LHADAVEDAPSLDGLAGFITEKGIFESGVVIRRREPHRFGELAASRFSFADL